MGNRVDWGMFYMGVHRGCADVCAIALQQEGHEIKMLREGM